MSEIRFWRGVFYILALALTLLFLVMVWKVLLPFLFGLILAYLINPMVERFVVLGFRRDRVVIILYILLLGVGGWLGSLIFPRLFSEFNNAVKNLPSYAEAVNSLVATINSEIHQYLSRFLGSRAESFTIPFHAEKWTDYLFSNLQENIFGMAHYGLWVLIIPFVSFFALIHGPEGIKAIFNFMPCEYVESLLGFLAEINTTLGGFFRGLFLESMTVGLITMLGLLILNVKGAILLAFLTALLNVIPFMALLVGGGISLFAGFFQGLHFSQILGIFLLFVSVRILDDFLIIPFVLGHAIQLHPIYTLFAILAGVEVGGFLGLVFAIPMAAIIKVVITTLLRDRRDRMTLSKQHVYS